MKKILILQVTLSTLVLLILDLITKNWAQNSLSEAPWAPLPWFKLTYSENTGIAFGIPFEGPLLIVLTLVLIVGLIVYIFRTLDLNRLSVKIMISFILSGALGNLIDRIYLGAVRDFIGIGPWPLFNVADTVIVIGLALLLIHLFKTSHERRN